MVVTKIKVDLKLLPSKWEALVELRQLCAAGKGVMVATAAKQLAALET